MNTVTNRQRFAPERVADSFSRWLDLCARCAADLANAGIKAEKEALKAAVKTKHATRV
jgi:hypothetical protein